MILVKVQHIPLQLEMVTKPIEMSLLPDQPKLWEAVSRKRLVYINLFTQIHKIMLADVHDFNKPI